MAEIDILEILTSKDDKSACAAQKQIVSESDNSNTWYKHFDKFVELLSHPKSLVRNRAIYILAAIAKWDTENRFDSVITEYLSHITDKSPITSRQCIKALKQIGKDKPQYISMIISQLDMANLEKYKDTMQPLLKKDIAETKSALNNKD